ncbi:AraC-type DNA-binding protein [Kosakonia arachidis]|uniref:AraC-type DNA-binding protein n=1 Tax=Kosakonia arachidis TaxID=551989 RepID=A0A1I6YBG0_9ENTR|nr:AraC family transcriptional regulator [Kosakonia arachidis]SFT47524.1 AraC-type DNA-binding protein [Kosakonia arachidis]
MRDSTEMNTDIFSDILKVAEARSLVTGGFTAGGRWAIRFPAPTTIKFFAIVQGQCYVMIDDEPEALHFATGDVGLLSAQRGFVLASHTDVEPLDAMSLFSGGGKKSTQLGDGSDFRQIGGHVLLDPVFGPVLREMLPSWIQIHAASPQATTIRWLLQQLVAEQADGQPGAQLASAQLAQLLFIQVLRVHMQKADALPAGWLRAMCDRRIAPAMSMLHGDPAHNWRLEELASACAMSRTTFALRFRTSVGCAPLTYLQEWRMHLGKQALRKKTTSVAEIAQTLGYASASAFSNAFRRVTGMSPKTWREAGGYDSDRQTLPASASVNV